MAIPNKAAQIARLNDAFRTTLAGGQVIHTAGVQALDELVLAEVIKVVQSFNDFTEDNDPYGERDFGSFRLKGQRFFFKIDYYDPTLTYRSEDPADLGKTKRVMTIILTEEY